MRQISNGSLCPSRPGTKGSSFPETCPALPALPGHTAVTFRRGLPGRSGHGSHSHWDNGPTSARSSQCPAVLAVHSEPVGVWNRQHRNRPASAGERARRAASGTVHSGHRPGPEAADPPGHAGFLTQTCWRAWAGERPSSGAPAGECGFRKPPWTCAGLGDLSGRSRSKSAPGEGVKSHPRTWGHGMSRGEDYDRCPGTQNEALWGKEGRAELEGMHFLTCKFLTGAFPTWLPSDQGRRGQGLHHQ